MTQRTEEVDKYQNFVVNKVLTRFDVVSIEVIFYGDDWHVREISSPLTGCKVTEKGTFLTKHEALEWLVREYLQTGI